MPERIAIKQLRSSDLSFFEAHFRLRPNQRQKGINKDVFIDQLYPGLKGTTSNIVVATTILGPGRSQAHEIRRPITPPGMRKNWRLNAGTVHDSGGESGRFGRVQIDNLAVVEFVGDPEPEAVTLVIISAHEDPALRPPRLPDAPAHRVAPATRPGCRVPYVAARPSAGSRGAGGSGSRIPALTSR